MSWLDTQMAVLDMATGAVEFAVNWWLQSTLLIAVGLTLGRLLRGRGSALQSLVFRTTLTAVLVCPLATWSLSRVGVPGWSVKMPRGWSQDPVGDVVTEVVTPDPAPVWDLVEPMGTRALWTEATPPGTVEEIRERTKFSPAPMPITVAETPPIEAPSTIVGWSSQSSVKSPVTEFTLQRLGIVALGAWAIWLCVSMGLTLRLATAWRRLNRLRRRAVRADAATIEICHAVASALDVFPPEVLRSPCLPSPCLAGIRRPAVLLPELDQGLSIREVLIHELAHLRRRDCHWNLLRQMATAVFFFQPLLWKLSRRLETTAEEVCDDYVVAFGGDRQEYAHRLVDMAELSSAPIAAAGVGIVSLRSMLAQRVSRIMDTSRTLSTRVGNLLLAVVLLGGLIGTTMVGLVGLRPQPSQAEAESMADESITDSEYGNDGGQDKETREDKSNQTVVDPRVEDRTENEEWSEPARKNFAGETGAEAAGDGATETNTSATIAKNAKDAVAKRYECQLVDAITKRPVAGATVSVQRRISGGGRSFKEWPVKRNTDYTTDVDGRYTIDFSADEVNEGSLYVEVRTQHPDYVDWYGGYSYSMITKNLQMGSQPFFASIGVWPAVRLTGTVVTPGGKPAPDVEVSAYSRFTLGNREARGFFSEGKTNNKGDFRLTAVRGGKSVVWLSPKKYCPATHVVEPRPVELGKNAIEYLKLDQLVRTAFDEAVTTRDLGQLTLENGIVIQGRVVDVDDTGMGGVWVNASLQEGPAKKQLGMRVADQIDRSALTDADGRYRMRPLPPGTYRVFPSEEPRERSVKDRTRRPVPAEFLPRQAKLAATAKSATVDFQAVPHITVVAQYYRSSGEPRSGHEINFIGKHEDTLYWKRCRPDANGRMEFTAPVGLEEARLDLVTNEHSALRHRLTQNGELMNASRIELGRLTQDMRQIVIIRYAAPILLIQVVDKDGQSIEDPWVTLEYAPGRSPLGDSHYIRNDRPAGDVSLEEHGDGRWRTSQLLPDEELTLHIESEGHQSHSEILTLAEGETREVVVTLKKKLPQQNAGDETEGSGAADRRTQQERPETGAAVVVAELPKTPKERGEKATISEISGKVLGADGKPVAGARFYWLRTRVHDLDPMQPRLIATSDAAGNYRFNLPSLGIAADAPASWAYLQWMVVRAAGHGFSIQRPGELRREMEQSRKLVGALASAFTGRQGVTVQLPEAGDPLRGRLVDIDGRPVVGATVRIRWFTDKESYPHDRREAQVRDPENADWRARVARLLRTIEPAPLREVLPVAETDATGRFELRDIGPHRLFQLLVEGGAIESTEILARNESGERVDVRPDRHTDGVTRTVYGREFLHVVGPSRPVEGQVLDMDTGQPVANAVVRAYRIHGRRLKSSREREHFATRTDSAGRYRITGLPIGTNNKLVAFTADDTPYIPVGHQVDTSVAGNTRQDFRLKRGVWAAGRVFDQESDKPFVGQVEYYHFPDRKLEESIPGLRNAYLDGRYWTNANGEFRVPVLPTRGILAFSYAGDAMDRDGIDRYPRGYGADSIEGIDDVGGLESFRTRPYYLIPSNYQRVVEVRPAEGQETVRAEMPLAMSQTVTIQVFDPEGQPLADCHVYGAAQNWGWQKLPAADFVVTGLRANKRRKVFVYHRDRNLAGGTIVDEANVETVQLKLQRAGSVVGRLVDADREPITDASLNCDYEKLNADDQAAIWAPHPELLANPTTIPVDSEGRFRLDGLIPGKAYNAWAAAPRKMGRQVMDRGIGTVFANVAVEPGQQKDLGDLVVSETDTNGSTQAANKSVDPSKISQTTVGGRISAPDGKPAAGADVAVIAMKIQPARGGDLSPRGVVLAEGTTDDSGTYRLRLNGASSKTHRYASVIARKDGTAVAWRQLNLDEADIEASLELSSQAPIRGRLVDLEGQPAVGVTLRIQSVMKRSDDGMLGSDGVGYRGGDEIPHAWLPPVSTDERGRFTVRGVPEGHGVLLKVVGGDRFAPQNIALNTGLPEQRGERDGTYRSLVKNVTTGEEAVLPLAAAQLFEGVVTYEDTGQPAPHARLTVWASQQEFGSMVSVAGKADAQGRYRISPHPGIRFGVTAYPPNGVPYLARKTPLGEAIRWEEGDTSRQVNVALPRGVLLRGEVVEMGSKAPVSGATIQYIPEEANNSRVADNILTGWQGIQLSDERGKFEIAVLPGPGRLLVHGPSGQYVLGETADRQLSHGQPGGRRNYAHAVHKISPETDAGPLDVTIRLQPGTTVAGRIVDENGELVGEALVISRLDISPLSLTWRGNASPALGGRFELAGLNEGTEYPVHFLDAKRRLGATARIRSDDELTIVLEPCGEAVARFISPEGQPHVDFGPGLHLVVTPGEHEHDFAAARQGKLAADADFVANIDRTNYWPGPHTDIEGRVRFPALIPGATYRLSTYVDGRPRVLKQFSVAAAETIDLGEITIDLDDE